VDAVIVVAAVFGLFAFARSLERFEARHFRAFAVLLVALAGSHLAEVAGPTLQQLESASSP
jgi:hypothetical protein